MAKVVAIPEPGMPWVEYQEDKSFRWITLVFLLLFLGIGVVLNSIQLPEVEQKNLVDISPRLAKLILEKQKVIPPPKKELPKQEIKKEVEKKKEKPKKKPADAREVAQQSGLLALSDELEDLRESFDLDDVLELPQQTSGKEAVIVATASDLLTSTATQSSGGIQTDTLNRTITTSELSQRQTTKVQSKIASNDQKLAKLSTGTGSGTQKGTSKQRSAAEIERVFHKNMGGIYSIYNRALRKNPSLAGKVVLELTIAPDGSITNVKILSSELGDEKLERKLLLKIKRFKFAKADVAVTILTYPIDFLPS
jgi:TonB family protein